MKKVTPFLWFKKDAEKAARFYVSIFKGAKILDSDPMSAHMRIGGTEIILFNGGPHFKLSPAVSLFITCKNQKEIDYYWRRLSAGGKKSHCGWLVDKFGLSWQVVPESLGALLGARDRVKAQRAMNAMLGMAKLDIKKLRRAYDGR